MDDERPPRLWIGMWKRFALGGVLIVLLCGGATAAVTVRTANQLADEVFPKLNQIHTPKGLISSIYTGGPKTFLILGSDKRYGSKNSEEREAGPRSDTILLVRFDPEQEQTSVLSIPRDLLVTIKMPGGSPLYPEKINAAYTLGSALPGHDEGANLAAETVKSVLPGLQLNGIIDVTFAGFIRVVDSLGCVYVNVDHRYFNENIGTPETDYTSIDLQPGYQKLCYENALDYVRYRHTDSDFVRVARQQDFLRDLREQVSPQIGEVEKVAKTVGHAISTNFSPSASILLELAKLIGFSQGKPLRQVKFQTENVAYVLNGGDYVTSSSALERATLEDFLHGRQHLAPLNLHASAGRSHNGGQGHGHGHGSSRGAGHGHGSSRGAAPNPASEDLYPTPASDQQQGVSAAVQVPFPLLYPRLQTGPATQEGVRPYALRDPQGHLHHAYTIVFQQNTIGGYYDVEGTDWLDPPIIEHPQETRYVGRRAYMVFADGEHIHMIAWREHHALYWVINTLLEELTNQQMLTIADSTQPLR
jgi:polyisoprenyl-teichoic acid--peptidoglycan teichoic acid transferase